MIQASKLFGKGYNEMLFTNCKDRYRVFFGGRNTKKSYNIGGYEPIFKILSNPVRNIIMFRANDVDNSNSTYAGLVEKIGILGLGNLFKCTKSPQMITYKKTGQVILFRGMNNPTGITSIKPFVGLFTDVYFEEASELKSYDDFRKVDGSIRGVCPKGVYLQLTFMLNPWDSGHWIHKVFCENFNPDINKLLSVGYDLHFDHDFNLGFGKGVAVHTSSYIINEFRDSNYDIGANVMKQKAPEIWKCEFCGLWGNTTDAVYPEFNDSLIKPQQVLNKQEYASYCIGIDFGLSNGEGKVLKGEGVKINSATTMQLVGIKNDYNKLSFINEYFWSNETQVIKKTGPAVQEELVDKIIEWKNLYLDNWSLMKGMIMVYVDCADAGGFRQGLEQIAKRKGLFNVKFIASTKMKIQTRVDFERYLMAWDGIEFSDACPNLIREIKNARRGEKGECRQDIDDHAINASEYAWYVLKDRHRKWSSFKPR